MSGHHIASCFALIRGTTPPPTRRDVRHLRGLLEQDSMSPGGALATVGGGQDGQDPRRASFAAILDQVVSGKLSRDEGVEQLISAAGDVEEGDESDDRPNDRKLDRERSESELERLRAEKRAADLLESLSVPATSTRIRILVGIKSQPARIARAREWADGSETKPKHRNVSESVRTTRSRPKSFPAVRELFECIELG